MRLSTPSSVERRWGFRASVHIFKLGAHVKVRRRTDYRHFVAKAERTAVFGRRRARAALWLGTWRSEKGRRGQLDLARVSLNVDYGRKLEVPPGWRVPIYPNRSRDWRRRGEVPVLPDPYDGVDYCGHRFEPRWLPFRDFEQVLLSLGASSQTVREAWEASGPKVDK